MWGGLGLWGGMGLSGDCGAELSVERTAILGPAKGHDIFVWRPSCVCVTTIDDSPVAICPALASAAVVGMFLKRTFSFPVFVQCPMLGLWGCAVTGRPLQAVRCDVRVVRVGGTGGDVGGGLRDPDRKSQRLREREKRRSNQH